MKKELARVSARYGFAGKRVKLIIISFFTIFALIICTFPVYADEATMKRNMIRTSLSEDNYSVFEASENKIIARGKYSEDRIRKMYIAKYEDASGTYSMSVKKDGSYEAELSVVPEEGNHRLIILLTSGAVLSYLIFYSVNGGWYFPDNNLAEENRKVFEHIYDAPSEAAGLYLSPNADAEEIAETLGTIRSLAEQVTEGKPNDYEKARAICRYIAENISYDTDARNTSVTLETIALSNVLKTKRTVCAGFANLFCAMAEAVGIEAINIKGGVSSGGVTYEQLGDGLQNHEWAAFRYEAEQRWVWADSCWNAAGNYENGEYSMKPCREQYFDPTDIALSFNHRADKAERRKYFEAKAETAVETTAEAEPNSTGQITSEPSAAETAAPIEAAVTTSYTIEITQPGAPDSGDIPEWVYYVIIGALTIAITATAAVIIRIIKNGRKY